MAADYSDWLNSLYEKHESETERSYYERTLAMKMASLFYHDGQKRCVECEHYALGRCTNYNQELTEDQAYAINQCGAYSESIPF